MAFCQLKSKLFYFGVSPDQTWSRLNINLYHCRTTGGEEVDIILEDRSGNIVGIEIKSSSRVTPDDFKGLKYLREKAHNKFINGIVLHTGSGALPFDEKLYSLPINALWEHGVQGI